MTQCVLYYCRLADNSLTPLPATAHYYLPQLSDKHTRMVVSLLSGGLAGATALFVSYPFDVARTRYV